MSWQVLTVCHAVVVLCANDIFMCHESDILARWGMHFCVATGISKKSNYVVWIQKKTFLFENNIIKTIYSKNMSLISIWSFNTFENLQNFHLE